MNILLFIQVTLYNLMVITKNF